MHGGFIFNIVMSEENCLKQQRQQKLEKFVENVSVCTKSMCVLCVSPFVRETN